MQLFSVVVDHAGSPDISFWGTFSTAAKAEAHAVAKFNEDWEPDEPIESLEDGTEDHYVYINIVEHNLDDEGVDWAN